MKKILLTMAFVLTALGNAWADDVTVGDITIPKGGSTELKISLTNSIEYAQLFQFDLELPASITVVSAQLNESRFVNVKDDPASLKMNEQTSSDPSMRIYRYLCKSEDTDPIVGNTGVILTVKLTAPKDLPLGVLGTGSLTGIEVTDIHQNAFRPESKTFSISIDSRIVLDEDATWAPDALEGAYDVTVKRTIKANQLSTICLPFAMTEAQVKAAFGDDVVLGDFTTCEANYEGDNCVGLDIQFNEVAAIEANHPYVICVSSNIDEFTVGGVDINPIDEPSVDRDEVKTKIGGKWYYFYNRFIGTYLTTNLEEKKLFLNSDKFWYSNPEGKTTIRGFRAYFEILDVLSEVEDAGSRILFSIGNHATKIKGVDVAGDDYRIYNLSGQQVNNPAKKGLYITKGKKVVIK